VSLSTGDHPKILQIIKEAIAEFKDKGVSVSLPSLRIETMISELPTLIASIKKTGLTFAPEAATPRLQKIINKNIDLTQLEKCVEASVKNGWRRVKLYFMIGLPGEEQEDVVEIAKLVRKICRQPVSVSVSVASFVPKPHTHFERAAAEEAESLKKKQNFLRDSLRSKKIKLKFHDVNLSFLEALLSRADAGFCDVIIEAWRNGARFDSWSEFFKIGAWLKALDKCWVHPTNYLKQRAPDEVLPWNYIDIK